MFLWLWFTSSIGWLVGYHYDHPYYGIAAGFLFGVVMIALCKGADIDLDDLDFLDD